jgi:tungstate transport system ATP-binding protein
MLYAITQLTKMYGERLVLDIPSLEIEAGGIYALLGPNGAGKTTLLNILGFLEPPTAGQILFRSQPVSFADPLCREFRKEVVLVDQHPILFSTTVYRNLEFGLKIRGIPKKERLHVIQDTLDLVGMESFAQAPAHRLSGGETQRVALARALATSPKVLLCDEPTSSVDIENQAVIVNILRQINKQKQITVLFTTHDRFQAASLAQQTLFLDHGRLSSSTPDNLFTAVFVPETETHMRCVIQDTMTLTLPGHRNGRARVLVNPEKVSLDADQQTTNHHHRWPGRVVQVMDEKRKIRVVVDIGVWITLLMDPEEYRNRPPLIGEQTHVVIPPNAVQIV